jgi:hypothetical protein
MSPSLMESRRAALAARLHKEIHQTSTIVRWERPPELGAANFRPMRFSGLMGICEV